MVFFLENLEYLESIVIRGPYMYKSEVDIQGPHPRFMWTTLNHLKSAHNRFC